MSEQLTIRELAPYLPYGLRVQYEGIINGKEISNYNKEWNKAHLNPTDKDYQTYKLPAEVRGTKTGYLKVIEVYKKFVKYRIGDNGLQTHYGTERFKPLLRPLSQLTETIEHNGKRFIPMEVTHGWSAKEQEEYELYKTIPNYWKTCLKVEIQLDWCYRDIKMLLKWHFDIFGLIPRNLALPIKK